MARRDQDPARLQFFCQTRRIHSRELHCYDLRTRIVSLRAQSSEPELRSVSFTLTIDKQDGRRFAGTFSSARGTSQVVAVVSRSGTIYLADKEGHSNGTLLAPNRMELCYLLISSAARVASCVELTKQQ